MPGSSTTAPINTNVEVKQEDDLFVGSPLKKHRASMAGFDDTSIQQRLGAGMGSSGAIAEALSGIGSSSKNAQGPAGKGADQFGGALVKKEDEDEEL